MSNVSPHTSYGAPNMSFSEHMLRRKTPNGTLAAGYDGTPVEWPMNAHASKYLLLPTLKTENPNSNATSASINQNNQRIRSPYATTSNVPSPYQQISPHSSNNGSARPGAIEALGSDLFWSSKKGSMAGVDSVLNQNSPYAQHYRLANDYIAPTALQPLWPPSLGFSSNHDAGSFVPHWPSGAPEPYQPLPGQLPNFQYANSEAHRVPQLSVDNRMSRSQTYVTPDIGAFPSARLEPDYAPKPTYAGQQQSYQHRSNQLPVYEMSKLNAEDGQQHGSLAYRHRDPGWHHSQYSPNLNRAYGNLRLNTTDSSHNGPIISRDNGPAAGQAQFKEKILMWAHRVYGTLLANVEQERRTGGHGQDSISKSLPQNHQTPRRPYPSWSSSQIRDRVFNGSPSTPLHTPAFATGDDQSLAKIVSPSISSHTSTSSSKTLVGDPSRTPSLSPPAKDWHRSHLKPSVNVAHASYVPPHFMYDHSKATPVTAANHAMEMLSRLCEESRWTWSDGVLLYGCLAFGVGNPAKAMKLFSRVLQNEPSNVEAMSNLAATLVSLDRKQEAEQYWLRSVKLQPTYFESIEHLVGLLHETHRGKEAVKIVEHVEQVLRDPSPLSGLEPNAANHVWRTVQSQRQVNISGYKISPSDNGRLLALIHGKGNVLYQMGDNAGAAKAFEEAILIGAGRPHQGVQSLIKDILTSFTEDSRPTNQSCPSTFCFDEPVLLPPEMALETARLVFPSHGRLPGLENLFNGMSQKAAISIVSNSLLSLAKIYQDGMSSSGASATAPRATSGVQEILALYYLSLSLQPSPSTANNVGILLAGVQHSARLRASTSPMFSQNCHVPGVVPGSGIALALAYYDYGLKLDPRHAHLYTNLGSLFKDIGQLNAAIRMYEKAVDCDGNFDIALANLANAVKDKGEIGQAINYYRRAVTANPDFAEAVCGLANALNSVCKWSGRGGIHPSTGVKDRWHVDGGGVLYDPKTKVNVEPGWIEQVVAIVDKQLSDGQSWGQGILRSVGMDDLLTQLGQIFQHQRDPCRNASKLRKALESWSGQAWEGARIVRLIERATKRLAWQVYQDKYVERRSSRDTVYLRPQLPAALAIPGAPTVLPFHTFTCPLSAKQIRKISQRNGLRVSCATLRASWLPSTVFEPPPPPQPYLNVGYVSSDFNNHPLAHLMQSVFGLHDRSKVNAICYGTTASDGSVHRQQIEDEAPLFYDASSWSIERLVNQIVSDRIHILVNLNGYTRGAKNEVFAARPAPIQMSFMGFAGTLGAEWCDYLLADTNAIPPQTLRPFRENVDIVDQTQDGNNDDDDQYDDWVYGENIIFAKDTFFCCDHRQSAPDAHEKQLAWPEEQERRWKMRKDLFPDLADDAIILGNFNQLYKV